MNAKEFYKQKTNHTLEEDCGVRLTGKELFELMEEYLQPLEQSESKTAIMTAKEFLFSKYPLVSPDWFNDNELTQEMIKMMEQYLEYAQQPQKVEQEEEKPTDEEIMKFVNEVRYKKLRGIGNMSTHRMTLGEIEWKELCFELGKAMRDNPEQIKSK